MSNRLTDSITQFRKQYEALDGPEKRKLDDAMALDFQDHFAYQETQARARERGLISTEEAQTCYIALGEVGSEANGGWAQDTDTPTKIGVTLLIKELLDK